MSLLADVVPAGGPPRRRRRRPAEQMAMAATFAGLGFGNAGVHIPHANAYPIAGRVRDFRPEGYPDDEPMVPHGMAVSLTAPEAFRFTFEAAPERHLRAAQLLAPGRRDRRPARDVPARGAHRPDARHRHPQRPRRRSATARPTSTTWSTGTLKQQRLLATAPREADRGRPRGHPPPLDGALVSVTAAPPTWSRRCAARASPTSTTPTLARALYSSDASLYRVRPAGRRPSPRTPTSSLAVARRLPRDSASR